MSARNREALALLPSALLVTAGFAAIFLKRDAFLSDASLTYGGVFLALCLVGHLVVRFTAPNADPYLFPLVAVLACFGLVELYRIDESFARLQAQWFVVGLGLFAVTMVMLKDLHLLERYRYTIAFGSILLLILPRLPGIGGASNGAYLSINVGPLSFQAAEFAKIGIVIFLASYLRDTRQVLIHGGRRFLGMSFPPLRHFGPLLAIWGVAMMLLIFIRDLGSSVMFFGAFLALLYVATGKKRFPVIGLGAFALGAYVVGGRVGHVQDRVEAWRHPFDPELFQQTGGSAQLAQSLFAQADGGLFGRGFGQAEIGLTDQNGVIGTTLLPAAKNDLIYSLITNETGLLGATAILLAYLLIINRGFRVATLARDPFSKLLATGLTSVFALQVFVIVGGVTKVIPLTGVTLPFISYGGSSIMANFVLLALLMRLSEDARRPT
ncbi:FtsW/RodA/SpoVE family cell cycle protein [Patulibacter minatonensis]|uniref:FtsW/RodA/SpoVE family cell cycle protein n=1 Tax=Patulibacter minatonensis TaxID=298163 RepID=UPI00047B8A55|nr:FtsW/RodA/SpoVE family cell cycle protein [Patulibacter minatonensis]